MSHQGDDPNRPRERQRTGTPRNQPQPTGQQPPGQQQPTQWQGQSQTTPTQQPQQQFGQGQGGGPQTGGRGQPGGQQSGGRRPSGQQGGMQPGGGQQRGGRQQPRGQPSGGHQQGTQPPQSGAQIGAQGAGQMGGSGQPGQFTQRASAVQSAPPQTAAPRQGRRLASARVEEVVSTDVVTARRDTPIATVASMLNENDVGSVIVVEDDGETPVGLLTDRKIALAVESEPEIGNLSAEELVSTDLITGRTDMTVFEALDELKEANIRRLPIVDEDDTLVGIVTLDDLLVVFGSNLGDAAELIATQTMHQS